MSDVTDPVRVHTMTKREDKAEVIDIKGLLARDEDFVRAAVEALIEAALGSEMTEAIGAAKGERTETRRSYRSGYYTRLLITRVGSWNCGCRRTGLGGFRASCSNVISVRKRRWSGAWPRCMCRGFRRGRSRR